MKDAEYHIDAFENYMTQRINECHLRSVKAKSAKSSAKAIADETILREVLAEYRSFMPPFDPPFTVK